MKRILLISIAVVAAFVAFQRIRACVVSEETKIRWRIEAMEEGFNEAKVSPCLRGVAEGWHDSGSRIDRALLGDVLRSVFFQEREHGTKRFRYRVEIEGELQIELESEEGRSAPVSFVLRFDRLDQGEWTPTWRVRVEAEMVKGDELGWQIARTERETLWSDGRLVRAR